MNDCNIKIKLTALLQCSSVSVEYSVGISNIVTENPKFINQIGEEKTGHHPYNTINCFAELEYRDAVRDSRIKSVAEVNDSWYNKKRCLKCK